MLDDIGGSSGYDDGGVILGDTDDMRDVDVHVKFNHVPVRFIHVTRHTSQVTSLQLYRASFPRLPWRKRRRCPGTWGEGLLQRGREGRSWRDGKLMRRGSEDAQNINHRRHHHKRLSHIASSCLPSRGRSFILPMYQLERLRGMLRTRFMNGSLSSTEKKKPVAVFSQSIDF